MWLMKAGMTNEPYRFPVWKTEGYCAVGYREVQEEIPADLPANAEGKARTSAIVSRWLPAYDVQGATLSLHNFCTRMQRGDLVVVWREDERLLHFAEVTGPLRSGGATDEDDYGRRRDARWFGTQPCPAHLISAVNRRHPTVERQETHAKAFMELAESCEDLGRVEQCAPGLSAEAGGKAAVETGLSLSPYRPLGTDAPVAQAQLSAPDAEKMSSAKREHRRLESELAAEAERRGVQAWHGRDRDHVYDVLWSSGSELTVCEVKSLTAKNQAGQLRKGIGQLLDYADDFREKRRLRQDVSAALGEISHVRCVLWVGRVPKRKKHWVRVCRGAGITLAWPGQEEKVFAPAEHVDSSRDRSEAPRPLYGA